VSSYGCFGVFLELFWCLHKDLLVFSYGSFDVFIGLFWCLHRFLLVSEAGSFGVGWPRSVGSIKL